MEQQAVQERVQILCSEQLAADVFRITVQAPGVAGPARPGQFVMVRVAEGHDPLLRRPFSIHQVTGPDQVQILFKVVGRGTGILARVKEGDYLDLVGPMGHGFSRPTGPVCLVGGGMGIAPLLFLGERLSRSMAAEDIAVLLGARTRDELQPLVEDFVRLGLTVDTATDDGSLGHHGLVGELLDRVASTPARQVYACGPYPMMRAISGQCRTRGWSCEVSLETMMACGLAACLGCALPRKDGAGYLHVCKQGPVFSAEEVLWL